MHLNPSISLTGAVLRGSKIENTHTYIHIYIYKEKSCFFVKFVEM